MRMYARSWSRKRGDSKGMGSGMSSMTGVLFWLYVCTVYQVLGGFEKFGFVGGDGLGAGFSVGVKGVLFRILRI